MDFRKQAVDIVNNTISNVLSVPVLRGAGVVLDWLKNAAQRKHFQERQTELLNACAAHLGDPARFMECIENYKVLETCAEYVMGPISDSAAETSFVQQTTDTLFRHMKEARNSGVKPSDKAAIQSFIQSYIELWKTKLTDSDSLAAYQSKQNRIVLDKIGKTVDDIDEALHNRFLSDSHVTIQEDHFPYIEIDIVEPYIPRRIRAVEQETDGEQRESVEKRGVLEILENEAHIVLLSEAGNGKSTELDNLYIQARASGFHPLYIQLKNYPHDFLLNRYWAGEYIERPLLVFDGLDEMSEAHRQEFIQKINGGKERFKGTPIVISSRRNFYPLTKDNKGAFDDFEVYELEPLNGQDIYDYFALRGINYEAFMNEVHKQNLSQIVVVPFYLIRLVCLFEKGRGLPGRNKVMSAICESMIEHDSQRGVQGSASLPNTAQILTLLRKTAFVMQLMHAVEFDDATINKLFDRDTRHELLYSGLMKRDDGKWFFVHNNFREYLAAEFLEDMPLDAALRYFVSPCDETKIQNFWINVFSYYVMINEDDKALENWVYHNCPHQMILFDKDRTTPEIRRKVLFSTVKYAESNYIWITTLEPDIEAIVNYCQNHNALLDMMGILETGTHAQGLYNVLHVIECFSYIYPDCAERLESLLMGILKEDTLGDYQKSKAIRVLTKHGYRDQLETILELFHDCGNTEINKCLLRMLYAWGLCADRTEDVIAIIERNQESRMISDSGYSWAVDDALGAAKTLGAIRCLVTHITSEDECVRLIRERSIDKLITNAISLYKEGIYEVEKSIYTLMLWTADNWCDLELSAVLRFYIGTERVDLFLCRMRELNDHAADMVAYYTMDNPHVTKAVIDDIDRQRDGYEKLMDCLFRYAGRQNPYFDVINALSMKHRGVPLVKDDEISPERRKEEALARYLDALCEKERYERLIIRLKEAFGEAHLSIPALRSEKLLRCNLEDDLRRVSLVFVRVKEASNMDLEADILDVFQDFDFECLRAVEVQHILLDEKKTIELPAELNEKIIAWCRSVLHVYSQSKDHKTIYYNVLYAINLVVTLDIELDTHIYLSMLLFPGNYTCLSTDAYLQFIENKVPEEQLRARIQEDLRQGDLSEAELDLHILYCKEHHLPAALHCAIQVCGEVRDHCTVYAHHAFRYILDQMSYDEAVEMFLPTENKALLRILVSIDELRYNKQVEEALIKAYEDDHDSDWILSLIQMQSKAGAEYYLEEARRRMTLPDFGGNGNIHHITETISVLNDPALLDATWQMLSLACDPGFRDAEFLGLGDSAWRALRNIAAHDFDAVMSRIDVAFCDESTNETMRKYLGSLKRNILQDRLLRSERKLGWRAAKAEADRIQRGE